MRKPWPALGRSATGNKIIIIIIIIIIISIIIIIIIPRQGFGAARPSWYSEDIFENTWSIIIELTCLFVFDIG